MSSAAMKKAGTTALIAIVAIAIANRIAFMRSLVNGTPK